MWRRMNFSSRRGVTLMEALITILIVFIIVSGSAYLIYTTIVQEMNSERLALANNFARERIEYIKSRGYDNIAVGETSVTLNSEGDQVTGGLYTVVTRVAFVTHPDTGEALRAKTIVVEVYVNRPDRIMLVSQETAVHERGV